MGEPHSPAVLDLFSGAAGAWTLGLHWAGFRTVAACEADPDRRAAYATNWPEVKLYDDVRAITADRLLADVGPVDVIAGSPPCQDASAINKKGKGIDGDRTGLFRDAVRIVREVRPRWACFENVPGLGHRGLDGVLRWMDDAGYQSWTHDMGSEDVGALCQRRRLWILARAKEGQGRTAGQPWQAVPHALARVPGDGAGVRGGDRNEAARGHLRVYADVPAGVARGVAEAYGDSTPPYHARLIGRAIFEAERAMEGQRDA